MRRHKAALRSGAVYSEPWLLPRSGAFHIMSKKYELVLDKIALPGGGFVEAFRMALVDLSCFGEGRRLDLAGYPHESEAAALHSDWAALGVDFKQAAEKVLAESKENAASAGAIRSPGSTPRR